MNAMTIDDLKAIMSNCTGVDEAVSLDGDILDTRFPELGYDSLAVLEVVSQVQRTYRLNVPDEAIEGMRTPGDVVAFVNSHVAAAA